MTTSSPTVAVLGTGTMGAPMARNLAAAGLDVRAWNRTPERATPLGDVATVCATPAQAVAGADVVVTMLFDADSVLETMREARDGLAPGTIWLQQSTIGVAGCDRATALAEELGVMLVDAPVLGTKAPAEQGTLVVLASGPDDALDRVAPVLDAVGGRTLRLGAAGQGSRLKLVANAWVATVVEGVAESLALARALGLDPSLFLEAVRGGPVDSPYVQAKGGAMVAGDFAPSFALAGALKDVDLILAAAADAGMDLGLAPGVRDHFARGVAAGHGDLDMSVTFLSH